MNLPACVKITTENLKNLRFKDPVEIVCPNCNKTAIKTKFLILDGLRLGQSNFYCNQHCRFEYIRKQRVKITCKHCLKECVKFRSQLNKNNFCSQSCATTYNNQHKKYGYRRSKLEQWIEKELIAKYSNICFHFNRKDAINSELDIYIPSLKLAFELNGIFHYEKIYSDKQFVSIQNNDKRKFQACLERGIELCIIDTSKQQRFTEKSSVIYIDIITDIINNKLMGDI